MKVTILGCGPAGLLACHAAKMMGHTVQVWSKKVMSPMGGAQYLHSAIPGATSEEPNGIISYLKFGTAEGYAKKVYGDPAAPTSWNVFREGDHPAWSLRDTYRKLWVNYHHLVTDKAIDPGDISSFCASSDLVLSTIPAVALCTSFEHSFQSQRVVLLKDAHSDLPDNTIEYDGNPEVDWYRRSNLFDAAWAEYSRHTVPHVVLTDPRAERGLKPLTTDCDCHTQYENYHRLGRFGRWEKAILTDHAFNQAMELCKEFKS